MKHDHRVTREEALAYIRRRQARKRKEINVRPDRPFHEDDDYRDYKGGSFDRAIIDEMLAQPGATGLRVYRGDREDGSPTHVLVAVDASGEDILEVIAEIERPCPPYCSPSGILGSGV